MKQTILILILSFSTLYSIAQCDKSVTYFSGKAEFIDTAGKVDRSEEGKIIVKVTRSNIILMHNDDDSDTMNGEITDRVCEWKEPFRNGTTTFTTRLIEKSGESNDAAVNIKGKEGKLVILINFKNRGKILKLVPDSHKEEKE